jgi:ATP-dependent DNA helicase RecG
MIEKTVSLPENSELLTRRIPCADIQLFMKNIAPSVTVRQLSRMLSVSERTIYRNLDSLKEEHAIERLGADKKGYWKIKS